MKRVRSYLSYFVFVIIFSISLAGTSDLTTNHVKFVGENSDSVLKYARQKIAKMHEMKHKLEQQRLSMTTATHINKTESQEQTKLAIFNSFRQLYPNPLRSGNYGLANSIVQAFKLGEGRSGFWNNFFPSQDILKKLSKMRDNLEPNLKSYITTKYNDFLTNLVPYSETIGVPPFVLNSMKIPQNFDPRWSYIDKLLESSSVENFLRALPDTRSTRNARKLNSDDMMESRSDDDFISDQEPHPVAKGKKKYRFPNRIKVYRKGESLKTSPSERAGYEPGYYSTAGSSGSSSVDHFGLYGTGQGPNNAYDSYGKAYEDYYSSKRATEKTNLYDDYSNKGSGKYLTSSGFGETIAAGHHSYSSKGQSHGHGGGGGGHGLGGYLDPFSILGGLAFLTYLGLLFQQSMNSTAMGRGLPESLLLRESGIEPYQLRKEETNFGKILEQKDNQKVLGHTNVQSELSKTLESIRNIYLEGLNETCKFQMFCKILKKNWKNELREKLKEAFTPIDSEKVTRLYKVIQLHRNNTNCRDLYRCD